MNVASPELAEWYRRELEKMYRALPCGDDEEGLSRYELDKRIRAHQARCPVCKSHPLFKARTSPRGTGLKLIASLSLICYGSPT